MKVKLGDFYLTIQVRMEIPFITEFKLIKKTLNKRGSMVIKNTQLYNTRSIYNCPLSIHYFYKFAPSERKLMNY